MKQKKRTGNWPQIEFFKGEDSQWRWHLLGGNGEIMCQGESHKRKDDARQAACRCMRAFLEIASCNLKVRT